MNNVDALHEWKEVGEVSGKSVQANIMYITCFLTTEKLISIYVIKCNLSMGNDHKAGVMVCLTAVIQDQHRLIHPGGLL